MNKSQAIFTWWANNPPAEQTNTNSLRIFKKAGHPMGHITDRDLISCFDVLLREEDLNSEVRVVPMMCIGNACVVDAGQTNADN